MTDTNGPAEYELLRLRYEEDTRDLRVELESARRAAAGEAHLANEARTNCAGFKAELKREREKSAALDALRLSAAQARDIACAERDDAIRGRSSARSEATSLRTELQCAIVKLERAVADGEANAAAVTNSIRAYAGRFDHKNSYNLADSVRQILDQRDAALSDLATLRADLARAVAERDEARDIIRHARYEQPRPDAALRERVVYPDFNPDLYILSEAERAVFNERRKQRAKWGDKHDDGHDDGSLLHEASAVLSSVYDMDALLDEWGMIAEHPHPRERLVIAAALILADIERRDRAALSTAQQQRGGTGAVEEALRKLECSVEVNELKPDRSGWYRLWMKDYDKIRALLTDALARGGRGEGA